MPNGNGIAGGSSPSTIGQQFPYYYVRDAEFLGALVSSNVEKLTCLTPINN